jgi:hypothetical protein
MAIQADNHENMEPNLNNDGLLPSAIALKDSLNQKPDTSPEPMMLTAYQQELLRQLENEIDEYLAKSSHLDAFLSRLRGSILSEVG